MECVCDACDSDDCRLLGYMGGSQLRQISRIDKVLLKVEMPYSSGVAGRGEQEPRKSISTKRSRYSSGNAGGAGQFEIPEERTQYTPSSQRGSGVRGRGIEFGSLAGRGVRGRSGAARAEKPAEETVVSPTNGETGQLPTDSGAGGSETRVSATGVVQKGRNFDTMQSGLLDSIASRYQNNEDLQGIIRGTKQATGFSSNRLYGTDDSVYGRTATGDNAFSLPDMELNTGGKQNTDVNVGFSTAESKQFEMPNAEMSNITTEAGVKQPVEYTNHMRTEGLDGMDALRLNDAQKGLMYASGQFWGKSADGTAIKIDRDLAKSVRRGDEGAQDQLAAYLKNGGVKPDAAPAAGEFTQANPDIPTGVADKPEQSAIAPSDVVDFKVPEKDEPQYGKQYTGNQYGSINF